MVKDALASTLAKIKPWAAHDGISRGRAPCPSWGNRKGCPYASRRIQRKPAGVLDCSPAGAS